MKIYHAFLWFPLVMLLGFLIGRMDGFSFGEALAALVGAFILAVIVPCCFAPLFIDLDQYKDQRHR